MYVAAAVADQLPGNIAYRSDARNITSRAISSGGRAANRQVLHIEYRARFQCGWHRAGGSPSSRYPKRFQKLDGPTFSSRWGTSTGAMQIRIGSGRGIQYEGPADQAARPAGGYRAACDVPCVGPVKLYYRAIDQRRRRRVHAVRPGFVGRDGHGLRLEDIELIKQLKHRYLRFLDTADREALPTTMHPTSRSSISAAATASRWRGGTTSWPLCPACGTRTTPAPYVHHPEITVHDDETADGIWYLTDYAPQLQYRHVDPGRRDLSRQIRQARRSLGHPPFRLQPLWERYEKFEGKPNLTSHLFATLDLPEHQPGY